MTGDGSTNREEQSFPATYGRNLTEVRRQRALLLVQRRVDQLTELLKAPLPQATVLRGSATCAEVRLADADSIQRFIQVIVTCPKQDLDAIEVQLAAQGFKPGQPRNDTQVVRIAHQASRRPVFILLEDPNDPLFVDSAPSPASEEGFRMRSARLQDALRTASRVLARTTDNPGEFETETETFEIHLVVKDPDTRPHV